MKKINKVLLSISGICAAAGVVLILAGFITGVSKNEILASLSVTSADFGKHVEKMVTSDMEDTWKGNRDDLDMNQWQMKQYDNIDKLDIHIGVGQLEIQEYDGDTVQVFFMKGDKWTEVKQDGQKVKIRQIDNSHAFGGNGIHPVKILVPKEKIFEKVDIEIGAGEGIITSLKTDEIGADVGAGSLEVIQTIQAKKANGLWEQEACL